MKHLFLVNPVAGKGNRLDEFLADIRKHFQGQDYEVKVSQKPGDITSWAKQASQKNQELRVYACGGDGTLNEVVNGVAGCFNVAVTHVARGSGNDFIRLFTDAAPFHDLESFVKDTREVPVDLIQCNGDYALNVCSMGFDARIGTQIAAYKKLPLVKGQGAYILSAVVNTIKGIHHNYHVEVNGEVVDGEQTMIYVGSGSWYGGGFHPVPDADPTDGILDVLLVKGVSRGTVMKLIGSYKVGKFRDYPHLIRYFRTKKITVSCEKAEPVNLDGELRMSNKIEISVAPFRLRFFYPGSVCLACKERADAIAV